MNFERHQWERVPENDREDLECYRCAGDCKHWLYVSLSRGTRPPSGCCWLMDIGDRVTVDGEPATCVAFDGVARTVKVAFGDETFKPAPRRETLTLTWEQAADLLRKRAAAELAREVRT